MDASLQEVAGAARRPEGYGCTLIMARPGATRHSSCPWDPDDPLPPAVGATTILLRARFGRPPAGQGCSARPGGEPRGGVGGPLAREPVARRRPTARVSQAAGRLQ